MIVTEMQRKPCMKSPLVSHCLGAGGQSAILIPVLVGLHLSAQGEGQRQT